MYKEILQSIEGVHIYPIISLMVFDVFFVSVLIWILKVDKNYIKKMENLPLESENNKNFTGDYNESN